MIKIKLDNQNMHGIFVRYDHRSEARAAFKGLNTKLFDKRPIICAYFEKEIMREL